MTGKNKYALKSTALLLITGSLGALIMLTTARWLVLGAARARLQTYAAELLRYDEKLADNITETLAEANAAKTVPCSAEDLHLLRKLLFLSPFMKDIGRYHNGMLVCSAVGGVFPQPIPADKPDLVTDSGRRIYYNHELVVTRGYRAQVIITGNASVVINPDVFASFVRPSLYFLGYIRSQKNAGRLNTYTSFPKDTAPGNVSPGQHVTAKGFLYYSDCSTIRPDCAIVGTPIADVLRPSNRDLIVASAAGALVGGAFCITILVMRRRRRSIEWRLRRAVQRNQLDVVYQPIVELGSEKIVAAEALVRWADEDGATIPTEYFITMAEERGFIFQITQSVLARVLTDLKPLLALQPSFQISINICSQDLLHPEFLPGLARQLRQHSIRPANIGFELTERSAANDTAIIHAIRELRQRGHTVSIDDFGTGYSSLSYLHNLAVDSVKVDSSFTRTIGTGSLMESIVPQILAMAEALHLKVVVEGIERPEQVDYLATAASNLMGQGWLFGRPVSAADLSMRLQEEPAPATAAV